MLEYADQNAGAVSVSPNIVFSSLQAVEETEELIAGVSKFQDRRI
jgi:hypothetical protein